MYNVIPAMFGYNGNFTYLEGFINHIFENMRFQTLQSSRLRVLIPCFLFCSEVETV